MNWILSEDLAAFILMAILVVSVTYIFARQEQKDRWYQQLDYWFLRHVRNSPEYILGAGRFVAKLLRKLGHVILSTVLIHLPFRQK